MTREDDIKKQMAATKAGKHWFIPTREEHKGSEGET